MALGGMPQRLLVALAGALCLALPVQASAGGFFIGDIGARGLARGGAFVAAPDSVLALHYNPGALSLLGEGLHVEVDISTVSLDYQFTRTCPCIDPSKPGAAAADALLAQSPGHLGVATNSAGVQLIPFITAAYQLPWHHLTIAAGVYAMTSPGKLKFGKRSESSAEALVNFQPQRYSLIDLDLFEAYYNLGVSIEPIEGLRLGFVGQLYEFRVTQAVNLWGNTTLSQNAEDITLDIPVVLSFAAPLRPNFMFGISYTPTFAKEISVGFSMMGKRNARSEGNAKLVVPKFLEDLGNSGITGSGVNVEVNLPAMIRGGVQYAVPQVFAAEVALEVETWSDYDRVVVRGKDIAVSILGKNQPLGKVILPERFQNTFSIRAGGELNIWEPVLSLRAGYSFETSAMSKDFIDASAVDFEKHGLHFGAATTWAGVTLQAGMAYFIMPSFTTTTSEKSMIGPLTGDLGSTELLTRVGNGTYSGSYFLFSGSISVALDPLMKAI